MPIDDIYALLIGIVISWRHNSNSR
jgi:hypothetical protein